RSPFFFSSRRRHTRLQGDWSSDVCSSDLGNFIRIAGCNSCHSQDLASAAAGFVKSRGLKAPAEIPQLPQSMMPSADRLMDLAVEIGRASCRERAQNSGAAGPRTQAAQRDE